MLHLGGDDGAVKVGSVGDHGVAEEHEGPADADDVQQEEDAQRIPTADPQILVQTVQFLRAHDIAGEKLFVDVNTLLIAG